MPAIVHDYPEIAKRLRGDDWWQAKKPDAASAPTEFRPSAGCIQHYDPVTDTLYVDGKPQLLPRDQPWMSL